MKKSILKILPVLLFLPSLYFVSPSAAHAQEMACETHTEISIDVKPGETPNKINMSSRGLLPVAVLNTDNFDADQFTPEMAHLSDSSTAMS